jgi:hypothetical protein
MNFVCGHQIIALQNRLKVIEESKQKFSILHYPNNLPTDIGENISYIFPPKSKCRTTGTREAMMALSTATSRTDPPLPVYMAGINIV